MSDTETTPDIGATGTGDETPTTGRAKPWPGFFDPDEWDKLYAYDSNVDWWRGDWAHDLEHPVQTVARAGNQWLMPYKTVAQNMVRTNREQVVSLMGALFSWRVATVGQLQAGLCDRPLPDFTRDEPTIYGALNRLGIINVGFSRRERMENITLPHVWLSVGNREDYVKELFPLVGAQPWLRHVITTGRYSSMRQHARHNTYASHIGLTAAHDPRVRLTAGDGWGAFRLIDPMAAQDASVWTSSTDVTILTKGNVMAGIEAQSYNSFLDRKFANWAKLLAASPMQRRGLLCVFLFFPRPGGWRKPSPGFFQTVAQLPEMAAGDPPVATRLGYATWDEWYDHGYPTGRFGQYTDMMGVTRSIFDPEWSRYAPQNVRDPRTALDWGWHSMRRQLMDAWGWDVGSWTFPDDMRGGFHGFVIPGGTPPADGWDAGLDNTAGRTPDPMETPAPMQGGD